LSTGLGMGHISRGRKTKRCVDGTHVCVSVGMHHLVWVSDLMSEWVCKCVHECMSVAVCAWVYVSHHVMYYVIMNKQSAFQCHIWAIWKKHRNSTGNCYVVPKQANII
jgi:hypothetical protein